MTIQSSSRVVLRSEGPAVPVPVQRKRPLEGDGSDHCHLASEGSAGAGRVLTGMEVPGWASGQHDSTQGQATLRQRAQSLLSTAEGRALAVDALEHARLAESTQASKRSKLLTLQTLARVAGVVLFLIDPRGFGIFLGALKFIDS